MDYERKTERLDARRPEDVERAARLLREGGTVAFPTETVYGLGANAFSAEAVEKVFVAKQRPHWDPLIVHVCDREMVALVASAGSPTETFTLLFGDQLPGEDRVCFQRNVDLLADAFWPGPLTLLLPRTAAVPDSVTAGRRLVGVRMPAPAVARRLIELAGVPIAAPSANRFGHTSPTTAAHVLEDLDGRIDAVLDGGSTEVGLESTVAQVFPDGVVVYRPGAVTLSMLDSVLGAGCSQMHRPELATNITGSSLPSPGLGLRHYAPHARLLLVGGLAHEALSRTGRPLPLSLVDTIDRAFDDAGTVGVMLPAGWNASCASFIYRWGDWGDGNALARRLFAGLRELDDAGASVIVCPVPEVSGIGDALRDRLEKAAFLETVRWAARS